MVLQKYHCENICYFSLHSKNHGGKIKGYQMNFFGHNLLWKELYYGFGSGRDWFAWNSTLPKSASPTVSELPSGEKYPGAMLLDFGGFFKWKLLQIWEFRAGFDCIQVSKCSRAGALVSLQISQVSEQIQLHSVVFCLNLRGSTTSCFKIEMMRMCLCVGEGKRFLFWLFT